MRKKILSVLLAALLITMVCITALCSVASAADVDSTTYYYSELGTGNYSRQFYAFFRDHSLADVIAQPENGYDVTLEPALSWTFTTTEQPTAAVISANQQTVDNLTSLGNDIRDGFAAVLMDRPDLFWLQSYSTHYSYGAQYSLDNGTYTVTVTVTTIKIEESLSAFNTAGYTNATLSADNTQMLDAIAAYKTANTGAFAAQCRYKDVKAIHDYIRGLLTYSTDKTSDPLYHTAVTAVTAGSGVCETYSEYFKLLCEQFDIPCVLVSGTATANGTSGNHEWCEVQMENGKWYVLDATWDDQAYEQYQYSYFLKGSNDITDHSGNYVWLSSSEVLNFTYPTLNASAYDHASECPEFTTTTSEEATTTTEATTAETTTKAETTTNPVTTTAAETTTAAPATTVKTETTTQSYVTTTQATGTTTVQATTAVQATTEPATQPSGGSGFFARLIAFFQKIAAFFRSLFGGK